MENYMLEALPSKPDETRQPKITRIPAQPKLKQYLRVAAYARVSSGKDAMLHSLSAQVSYFSSLIQAHPGWVYAGTYADEAYTGTKENRPEFQRMLEDCRQGKIDRVLTKSVSRFARNTVTLLETVRELKALGIGVTFQEQNIDTLSGDGELMISVLVSFAQAESKSVSDNCKWRIQKDFKEGKPACLRFQYGYQIKRGEITVNEKQASVVRRIYQDYLNGVGTQQIVNRLNAEKAPTFGRCPWSAKRVRDILKNEKYTGVAFLQKTYIQDHLNKRKIRNKGELPTYTVPNCMPPIISTTDFFAAQALMQRHWRKANVKKSGQTRYPFSGKVICGNCGQPYKRRTLADKITWQCGTYMTKGKSVCPAKQIPEETLTALAAKAMGIPSFDKAAFAAQIERVTVTGPNEVTFEFHNGEKAIETWRDPSRAESWTPEMKEQAKQNARRRYQHE